MELPVINTEYCNGCGLCTQVCQMGGLVIINNVVVQVPTTACDWCTLCEAVCPTGAISCPFEIVIDEKT